MSNDIDYTPVIASYLGIPVGAGLGGLAGNELGKYSFNQVDRYLNDAYRKKVKDSVAAARHEMRGSNEMANFLKKRAASYETPRMARMEANLARIGSAKRAGQLLGIGGAGAGAIAGSILGLMAGMNLGGDEDE